MLTPQQEQYFQTMEDMFQHPGWKLFLSDLEENQKALKDSALGIEKESEFFIAKGRNQTFNQVLGFESLVSSMHKSLLEDNDPSI
jgi:hypothetical protein